MLILRDMRESDIEDYVKWFTRELEWGKWDAPWEPIDADGETQRREWTEYFESVKDLALGVVRWKYEIECDGEHIGWVSSYTTMEFVENEEKLRVVGICIPSVKHWRGGLGTEALRMFIKYLRKHGSRAFYMETWSGNGPMLRVAEKLGFREVFRKEGCREVEGARYDAVTLRLDL